MSDGDKMNEERVNGGCEGPDAMFVKLISSDGHEFIIKREHALTSGTIKAMLSGPGKSLSLTSSRPLFDNKPNSRVPFQVNLRRMRQMRFTFVKFRPTSCKRCASTSHTKSGTQTAALRSPNFRSLLKLHWNC
jgi:hypothetical protein